MKKNDLVVLIDIIKNNLSIKIRDSSIEKFHKKAFYLDALTNIDGKGWILKNYHQKKYYYIQLFIKHNKRIFPNKIIMIFRQLSKKISKMNNLNLYNQLKLTLNKLEIFKIKKKVRSIVEIEAFILGHKLIIFNNLKIEKQQWGIEINLRKTFINNIILISPYAKSVLNSNQVKSIIWDTTFTICKPFCLIIPSAIILNTSIPLGIMICPAENSQNYDLMFCFIKEKTQIQLEKIPALIDLGKALQKFTKNRNLEKYFCHRHIIEYYGSNSSIFPIISKIINVDSDELKIIVFNSILSYLENIQNEKKKNEMIKLFKKMGLNYINKRIEIENNDKLESFINLRRILKGIPTTTNHLESHHGHLNEKYSRKRSFYSTFQKIIEYCFRSQTNYRSNVIKNYSRRTKKILEINASYDKLV